MNGTNASNLYNVNGDEKSDWVSETDFFLKLQPAKQDNIKVIYWI